MRAVGVAIISVCSHRKPTRCIRVAPPEPQARAGIHAASEPARERLVRMRARQLFSDLESSISTASMTVSDGWSSCV